MLRSAVRHLENLRPPPVLTDRRSLNRARPPPIYLQREEAVTPGVRQKVGGSSGKPRRSLNGYASSSSSSTQPQRNNGVKKAAPVVATRDRRASSDTQGVSRFSVQRRIQSEDSRDKPDQIQSRLRQLNASRSSAGGGILRSSSVKSSDYSRASYTASSSSAAAASAAASSSALVARAGGGQRPSIAGSHGGTLRVGRSLTGGSATGAAAPVVNQRELASSGYAQLRSRSYQGSPSQKRGSGSSHGSGGGADESLSRLRLPTVLSQTAIAAGSGAAAVSALKS